MSKKETTFIIKLPVGLHKKFKLLSVIEEKSMNEIVVKSIRSFVTNNWKEGNNEKDNTDR